jgi:hypothetical protein
MTIYDEFEKVKGTFQQKVPTSTLGKHSLRPRLICFDMWRDEVNQLFIITFRIKIKGNFVRGFCAHDQPLLVTAACRASLTVVR